MRVLTFPIFLFISFFFSNSVFAKFAIVDISQIEEKAIVTLDLKEKVMKAEKSLQNEVMEAEKSIKASAEEIEKQKSTLSAQAINSKLEALDKRVAAYREELNERNTLIQEGKMKALEQINQKVKDVTKKIAEKKQYESVFASTFVIYYSSENDITKDIINELNSEMKTVPFEVKSSTKKKK